MGSNSNTFDSCLSNMCFDVQSPKPSPVFQLKRAISNFDLEDSDWLSSSVINLVTELFAKKYPNCHFLSSDFTSYRSSSSTPVTDILGKPIDFSDPQNSRPIICVFNSNGIHWNVLRANRTTRTLELFEPMGKPDSRRGGISFRDIPQTIISWLNESCPLYSAISSLPAKAAVAIEPPVSIAADFVFADEQDGRRRSKRQKMVNNGSITVPTKMVTSHTSPKVSNTKKKMNIPSWSSVAVSAVTRQHQLNNYDCGVACLLYAEKCGQGMSKEDIDRGTTQFDISEFRKLIQVFMVNSESH